MQLLGFEGGCFNRRILFLFGFLLFGAVARGAGISIWTEPKPSLVFARENVSVRLFVKNSDAMDRKVKLEYRVYQAATGVSAPVTDRKKWKEFALSGNQTVVETLKFSPGTVKGSTLFLLKFYEGENVPELESLPLVVYPDNLLAELKEAEKTMQLAVFDEEDLLGPTLVELGAKKAVSLEEPMVSDRPIVLFVVGPKGTDLPKHAVDLAKWAAAVIWIRRPVAPTFDSLPVEVKREGRMFAISAERSMFADITNSVEAQINLIRCYRAAVKQLKPTQ